VEAKKEERKKESSKSKSYHSLFLQKGAIREVKNAVPGKNLKKKRDISPKGGKGRVFITALGKKGKFEAGSASKQKKKRPLNIISRRGGKG